MHRIWDMRFEWNPEKGASMKKGKSSSDEKNSARELLMKLKSLWFVAIIISVAGCASIKVPQATGGSRADGIVELSYEYGMFEKPQVQWDQALITARQRCGAWGYQDAEAFGGTTSQCQAYTGYGNCIRFFVTAKYQCIGSN